MVTKIGGSRRKTRYKLKKELRTRGKVSISDFLRQFGIGDKVTLKLEPAVQKGMYHPRFSGKTGVVTGQCGRCYEITIKDQGKEKTVIAHPIHLKRQS